MQPRQLAVEKPKPTSEIRIETSLPERPLLELRPAAREVLEVLRDFGHAAALYEGALRALATVNPPVREWMAAFAMRELLDELEVAARVGRGTPSLDVRVDALAAGWRPTRATDGPLQVTQAMIEAVDVFLTEHTDDANRRRARARLTIAGLDPVGREAPPVVMQDRAKALMELRDEFNAILHGRPNPADAKFNGSLDRLESFVLGWLRPQPSEDFAELDRFVQQGPPDA
jgi:hypothetical protein